MGKLYNIKGYWKYPENEEFNEDDSWKGQILLEDDGWFEGIVVDSGSEQQDRFVFGVYAPDKGIELQKLVPVEISNPIGFHGTKTKEGYSGEFEVIHLRGTTTLGQSVIKAEETLTDNMDKAIEALTTRIQLFKDTTMHECEEDLYKNSIIQRKLICTIHMGNFYGRVYSASELLALCKESKASTDKIVESTANELGMSVEDTKRLMFESNETPLSEIFEI